MTEHIGALNFPCSTAFDSSDADESTTVQNLCCLGAPCRCGSKTGNNENRMIGEKPRRVYKLAINNFKNRIKILIQDIQTVSRDKVAVRGFERFQFELNGSANTAEQLTVLETRLCRSPLGAQNLHVVTGYSHCSGKTESCGLNRLADQDQIAEMPSLLAAIS